MEQRAVAGGKTPPALHAGQPQLSIEAGMQSMGPWDCADTQDGARTCRHLRNAAKSQARTPLLRAGNWHRRH